MLANDTDYDTYGIPITKSGGVTNAGGLLNEGEPSDPDSTTSYGFGGGYEDATGFVYLVNRYYSPSNGMFISFDPDIAATGTPLAYVDDSPPDGLDPLGLDLCGADPNCGGGTDGYLTNDDIYDLTSTGGSAVDSSDYQNALLPLVPVVSPRRPAGETQISFACSQVGKSLNPKQVQVHF